jgi:glycosyltransferase involved in cell wall biosynthesis
VHAWEEPYVASGAQIANWTGARTKLIFATFQNTFKRYPFPFAQAERFAIARAAGVVAWGKTVAENLGRRDAYRGKPIRLIPAGVDVGVFRPDRARGREILTRLGLTPRVPVVGYLGRFVEEKGLRFLTRVLARLTEPWQVLFVGSGPLETFLREWASQFRDRARVAVGVTHDEVPAYLNAMDALCAPSQTTPAWREQFGRVIVEAFASGIPVIGSDSGEIPYTIGEAGVVVPESDEESWVRVIDRILCSASERDQLASAGLEAARSRFAWPVVARAHLDFFEQVSSLNRV